MDAATRWPRPSPFAAIASPASARATTCSAARARPARSTPSGDDRSRTARRARPFTELGASLQILDLRGTTSYAQIVERSARARAVRPGEWILGRSWDQNDWDNKEWPTHEALSAVSPDNPVYLTRVDGHAGLANRRALDTARVPTATPDPPGGRIIRTAEGQPTGVLIDRAQELVTRTSRRLTRQPRSKRRPFEQIGKPATGSDDGARCRDERRDGGGLQAAHRRRQAGDPAVRDAARLAARADAGLQRGPIIDYANIAWPCGRSRSSRTVRSARAARRCSSRTPTSRHTGLLTTPPEEVYAQTLAASRAGFQTAIHAIGDRANRS